MAGKEKESLLDIITVIETTSSWFSFWYKEQFWKVESHVCALLVINISREWTRNNLLSWMPLEIPSALYFISSVCPPPPNHLHPKPGHWKVFLFLLHHTKCLSIIYMLWSQSACVESWLYLESACNPRQVTSPCASIFLSMKFLNILPF